jgi:hypothetical protein
MQRIALRTGVFYCIKVYLHVVDLKVKKRERKLLTQIRASQEAVCEAGSLKMKLGGMHEKAQGPVQADRIAKSDSCP